MADFLGVLADTISSQYHLGENTNHTLDSIDLDSGKTIKYGALGDFANQFDKSAERKYVEEGFLRKDPYNTDPKQFEILMQEPNATVLVKKKMFSSVGENFRTDFMDADETLYYRSMKILFQNKCAQISSLEKLSKIQKITSAMGSVPDQLMPIIFTLTDSLNNGLDAGSDLFGAFGGSGASGEPSDFTKVIDRLRKIYAFNTTSSTTSWITDSSNLYKSQFGEGTGVIEITNFTNFTTTTSVNIDGGNFALTISDPYESMLITEYDIEKAISDATNMFYSKKLFQFSKENSATLINDLQARLNHIRSLRKASPISFKVDPDTLLGKRVTAILDRLGIKLPFSYDSTSAESIFSGGAFGQGTTIAPEYLKGGLIAGNDGLDPRTQSFNNIPFSSVNPGMHSGPDSEVSIFNRLVSTIFSKISLEANSQNAFQMQNAKTNFTRRKLRFNFSGKLIIQPMDTVHIYINSKSRYDNKLLSGMQNMFSGLGMLQNLNNTLTNVSHAFGALNPSGNVSLEIEKSAFVGKEFPNYLWSMIRNQYVSENEGAHVFAGVVTGANSNWADGKFIINVQGADNTHYFDKGKIAFKPGADTFNGTLYDPLTPFKSNFDSINSSSTDTIPELLDENKFLLGTSDGKGKNSKGAALVKYKLGRYAGEFVNEKNIIQDRNFDPLTGRITKVFYAPDGLVYKWKEGIGVFTQQGSNLFMNDPSKVGTPNLATEPFAGQNIMNVLSLLITGIPYNFASYYKAGSQFNNLDVDPQNKQNPAHSFLQSLKTDLIKSNTLWGNFIPFKNLNVDEASFVKALKKQTTILNHNNILNSQLKELENLNDIAMTQDAASVFSEESRSGGFGFDKTKLQLATLNRHIEATISEIQNEDDDFLSQVGDDVSFDDSQFIDSNKPEKSINENRRQLRRQLNFLTRRMSYNIRANEDKNLFIVDDFYDKDFDILSYESFPDGIKLYNNEYLSVKEKIKVTAGLLNLEVFCDSQGHIRCRPPQYNRMPSSVFYKMMYMKQTLNIQIFPQFLDDLFNTKLETLRANIEVLEDKIRLDCAILSYITDESAIKFILGNNSTSGLDSVFYFISDELSGKVTKISNLLIAANPDQEDDANPQDLDTIDNLDITVSSKNVFTTSSKYYAIFDLLSGRALADKKGIPSLVDDLDSEDVANNTRIDILTKRIYSNSGERVSRQDFLIKYDDTKMVDVQIPIGGKIDIFKVVNGLSTKIAERQKIIKLFYNTLRSAQEFNSLDNKSSTDNSLVNPGVYGNSHIPEVFEHMIEDEAYDDYGLNSGQRYIIKRSQIKSINIAETPPEYTAVEVQGLIDESLPNKFLPESFAGGFVDGGNHMNTAKAIDYDLWRMYGYIEGAARKVPFLQDAVSQCAPFASMLLSQARKNILRGSVTISGNEFMQPGEVVFIEDRQLLFYVTSVKHNFTFANSFTTTLELSYGHTPGEYIPNVSDMIGKMLYNNKDVADLTIQRHENSGNELSVGIVQRTINDTIVNKEDGFKTAFSTANAETINNILYNTQYVLNANNFIGNNVSASIELRIYHDDNNPIDNDLREFAESIRQILIGDVPIPTFVTVKPDNPPAALPKESVKIISESIINLHNEDDRRSPSQKAISACRNYKSANSMSGGSASNPGNEDDGGTATKSPDKSEEIGKDEIRTALFKHIVDCWVKIETSQTQTSNGS